MPSSSRCLLFEIPGGVGCWRRYGPGKNKASGGISPFLDSGHGPFELGDLEQVILLPIRLPPHQSYEEATNISPVLRMKD